MPASRDVAVVVGAGGQIGERIALSLAAGFRLAIVDLDPERLAAVAAGLPDDTLSFVIDASSSAAVDAAFEEIGAHGRVSAVAVAVGTTASGSLATLSDADWSATIDSCLTSTFQVLRASVTAMAVSGGAICVLGSPHATDPQPGFPAYAAAKAGVVALARQAAAEYGHLGIRVNVVTPGWTRTAHTESRLTASDRAALLDATPLRRLVEPADIADAVGFLLSPAARNVTGADILVDGGAGLLGGSTVLRDGYRSLLGLG